jgi:hypothetical protein
VTASGATHDATAPPQRLTPRSNRRMTPPSSPTPLSQFHAHPLAPHQKEPARPQHRRAIGVPATAPGQDLQPLGIRRILVNGNHNPRAHSYPIARFGVMLIRNEGHAGYVAVMSLIENAYGSRQENSSRVPGGVSASDQGIQFEWRRVTTAPSPRTGCSIASPAQRPDNPASPRRDHRRIGLRTSRRLYAARFLEIHATGAHTEARVQVGRRGLR